MKNAKGILCLLVVLLYVLFAGILPKVCFLGDMDYWYRWIGIIREVGLGNVYEHRVNYQPFFLYCLYLFDAFQGTEENLNKFLHYIKLIPLLFDFLGALLVFLVCKIDWKNLYFPFLLLFNVAYLYNSLLWGQVDSIHTFFVVLALLLALRKYPILALLAYVLAINMKLQSIIFLPIIGLLLVEHVKKPRLVLQSLLAAAALQLLLLLPFLRAGTLDDFYTMTTSAAEWHPYISMNAFNFWYYVVDSEPAMTRDSITFLDISYKHWGLSMFLALGFFTLLPMMYTALQQFHHKTISFGEKFRLSFLTAGLVCVLFFWVNTQMHERYAHPAILLFFFYGMRSKDFSFYFIVSLAYLLNMEKVLKAFNFNNYHTLIFAEEFIASLYLLVLLRGWYVLYYRYFKPNWEDFSLKLIK
ncbi:MAG: hypothetical protein AAGG75_04000, partial [Bacteroidota bacterium]